MDIAGDVVTADAMFMQKEIIDKIREKSGDFVIELKANRRSLRHVIEDRINSIFPLISGIIFQWNLQTIFSFKW